jgi:vacuolar-type H+-ATPase subunit I/STV1
MEVRMDNKANEGSAQNGEGQSKVESTVDVNELLKRVDQLEASNKRLLEESKGYKEKYKATAQEVTKKEEQLAHEKGDTQKLLDMERAKLSEVLGELTSTKEKILNQEIRTVVAEFASDAISLDDVLHQPMYAPILKEAVDKETLTVDREKAKRFVEEVRKHKQHLFKAASQPGVVTKKPGAGSTSSKPFSQMSTEEIKAALRSGQYK